MRDGLAESRTRAVLPLPDGRVAIATTATVDIFDGTRFTMSVELPPVKSINIEGYEGGRRLYIDKSNRLWLKNDRHQLYILDIDSGVPLSPDSVMKSIGFPENVCNVYLAGDTIAVITPENKLCIGTHMHCDTAITVTDIPDDIATHSGKLLLGFRSGRICTIKPDGTIASAVPPSAQPAKSPLIINVSGNSLYIGSSHTDSSAITAYSLPLFEQKYSFGTSGTISGISAVNDTLLVASNRGLSAYSQGGSKTKTLLSEPLTAIALDNQCGIWATTSGNGAIFTDKHRESLFKIDTTAYRNRTSPTFCSKLAQQLADTIAPGITNCSLYGSDGTIWLGTRKGLIATDSTGRIIAVIDRTSGLSTDNVQSVCLDKNGSIWITTANGISRIITTAPRTFSVTSFGQLDGILLDGREFRQARMYADTSGIIHAAFSGGVCSFSPDSLLNTSRYTYTVTRLSGLASGEMLPSAGVRASRSGASRLCPRIPPCGCRPGRLGRLPCLIPQGAFQQFRQFLPPLLRPAENPRTGGRTQIVFFRHCFLQNLRQGRFSFFAGVLPKIEHRTPCRQETSRFRRRGLPSAIACQVVAHRGRLALRFG